MYEMLSISARRATSSGLHVEDGGGGVVVEHDGNGHRLRDPAEVGVDLLLVDPRVVRGHHHRRVRAEGLRVAGVADREVGALVGGADDDRHPARRLLDGDPRDLVPLLVGEGEKLPVAREGDEAVDAFLDLVVHQPAEHRLVDGGPVLGERGDDHGVGAAELVLHLQGPSGRVVARRRRRGHVARNAGSIQIPDLLSERAARMAFDMVVLARPLDRVPAHRTLEAFGEGRAHRH